MENNTKKPGKMPHGFGTRQIRHFASSCPGLNIEEYDVYNRMKAIQNKDKDKQKKRQDAEAQRAAALRLEEVRGEVASTRIASSSSSASRLASPAARSALQVLASVAVSRSPARPASDTQSDAPSSVVLGLPNRCHFADCGAPGKQIPLTCGNPNCNRTLHVCCLLNAQVQAGLPLDPSQNKCDRCFARPGDGTDENEAPVSPNQSDTANQSCMDSSEDSRSWAASSTQRISVNSPDARRFGKYLWKSKATHSECRLWIWQRTTWSCPLQGSETSHFE